MSTATLTDTKTIDQLFQFLNAPNSGSYHYGIVFQEPQSQALSLHKMQRQPCLGELRPYAEDGDRVHRPSDLTAPWPKTGNPVAVGIKLGWWHTNQINTELRDTFFGTDGPWAKAFPSNKNVLFQKGQSYNELFVVITDTKVNPDILVNAFGVSRSIEYIQPKYQLLRDSGASPKEALALVLLSAYPTTVGVTVHSHPASNWMVSAGCKEVFTASPHPTTTKSFYDRGAYHRPKIEYLWAGQTLVKADPVFKKVLPYNEFLHTFRTRSAAL